MVSTLHLEKWSIHFNGKHMEGFEYKVLVLKNEEKEIILTALKLKDGKAQTIAELLQDVLEFNLWGSIVITVADTTIPASRQALLYGCSKCSKRKITPNPSSVPCS